tara:strand:- start:10177 stop:11085 length:909 start_codon:yes stop_codon:yes gene_type:complete
MTSYVFPGQGSQTLGMAKDFHDNFQIARDTFEEIEDHTNIDIRNIIFEDQDSRLDITRFTQICVFTASCAIFKTFINQKDLKNENINVMLGHSLGEYTALACSNKISLKNCSLILKKRGELMNSAVTSNITGMAALIGSKADLIEEIIKDNKLNLEIANDNSPIQVVISGTKDELQKSKEIFLKYNIKKFVLLNVSAAFHSNFMLDAQRQLSEEIENLNFIENNIKIISNYDATITKESQQIKTKLQKQMANKVNWTKSIQKLEEIGEKNIIEIGPGKVLSGLIKRISNSFDIISINKISDL